MTSRLHGIALTMLLGVSTLSMAGCVIDELAPFGGLPLAGRIFTSGQGQAVAKVFIDQCFRGSVSGGGTLRSCDVELGPLALVAALILVGEGTDALEDFFDPLVVQFPGNVSGFSGTFAGPASGALVIQSGLTCVNTAPGEQLCAEAGQQLVVLDVPRGTPNGTYDLTLNFTVTPAGAVTAKPVFAGKVVVGGQTFYPLIAPCVTSFANVSAITIPVSGALVGIPLNTTGVTACNRTINFANLTSPAASVPALGQPAFLALAVLLAALAVYFLGRSRTGA